MVNADSILLISQTMKCIEFGTPEDFYELIDEYTHQIDYFSFCGYGNIDSLIMDHAAKLLTAYAARFPLEFEKQYFSNLLSGSLCCAA